MDQHEFEKKVRKLKKEEILHLMLDAGIKDLEGMRKTIVSNLQNIAKHDEPLCFECMHIAKKLDMLPKIKKGKENNHGN